jgi:hypothetical protein
MVRTTLNGCGGRAGATLPLTTPFVFSSPAEVTLANKSEDEWSEMFTVCPTVARALSTSGLSRVPSPIPASTKSPAAARRILVIRTCMRLPPFG